MANNISNLTMNLFGVPYQFPAAVDPRVTAVSDVIGKKFTENIMLEAPICTIIPGVPSFLPGSNSSKRYATAQALIEGNKSAFRALLPNFDSLTDEDLRLYDFKSDYTGYMNYVNVMCRAGAGFLDINEDSSGICDRSSSFQRFDWKAYRWNKNASRSILSRTSSAFGKSKSVNLDGDDREESGKLNQIATNYNYIQFYIDADVAPNESLSNQTSESMMKSMFDQGSSAMKDLAFMANSGGIDTEALETFTSESAAALQSGVSTILGNNAMSGALSRIINLGGETLRGHNLIIPDIYQNSTYQKSYTITVHLKAPYGTKFGYYMDIFVPMMHLLALTAPRQESANSFSSPFLVKVYVPSVFTCNLGIVDSISINKVSDAWSVDGLPTEVDVTLNITDLYSDLMMTPSSNPMQFVNNSSMIEYLATNCGLDLTVPNFKKKFENIVNSTIASFSDVPTNVKSSVEEQIYRLIGSVTSLY